MLTRDQILAFAAPRTEVVAVPEWGGDVVVREMTAAERDAFETECFKGNGITSDNMRARLLVRCLCDDRGQRLFSDGDYAALGALPAGPIDRLFTIARKVNALTPDEVAELAKN